MSIVSSNIFRTRQPPDAKKPAQGGLERCCRRAGGWHWCGGPLEQDQINGFCIARGLYISPPALYL